MTQPTNPNEIKLLVAVYTNPDKTARMLVQEMGLPERQAQYWLTKWTNKGWYNWGVSPFAGWLEDAGKAKAREYIVDVKASK